MAQIVLTIADENVERVLSAIEHRLPIPLDANGDPVYTRVEWAKRFMRSYLVEVVVMSEHDQKLKGIINNTDPDADLVGIG